MRAARALEYAPKSERPDAPEMNHITYHCDACAAVFLSSRAKANRYLDPVCPQCESIRLTRVRSTSEALGSETDFRGRI